MIVISGIERSGVYKGDERLLVHILVTHHKSTEEFIPECIDTVVFHQIVLCLYFL